jgi:hypothetical protein
MQREQAHVGLLVVFGHPDGEQTLGRIIVVNPARAKVKTLESRGGHPVGTRFNVPYELIQPAEEKQAPAT